MIKIFTKSEPIYEQVLLFAGTLLPNEKIIVSWEDFLKIIKCEGLVHYNQKRRYIAGFALEIESINNFPRLELVESRTNRNFELKNV
jgi:hypothetical protein